MICILCYLSDEHQHTLKIKAHNKSSRFEDVLREYSRNFVHGLSNLALINKCENNHKFLSNTELAKYIAELQNDIVSNRLNYISSTFEEIIDIYLAFIQKNHISAYDKLQTFIYGKCSISTVDNPHGFCKPLFRVIPKPSTKWNYDIYDDNSYFHIPFTKRYLVGNQRYSISGMPMCYLADNLKTALVEVGMKLDDVNVAVYLPKYSDFYTLGIFSTTNNMTETLSSIISASIDVGSIYIYDADDQLYRNLNKCFSDYILYQILQYPTNDNTKNSFIQEYVLPQLLMEFVQNETFWIGVKYQSTKSIGNSFEIYTSNTNENYCFVVPYEAQNDYSISFKSNFFIALSPNNTTISIDEFKSQLKEYGDICKHNSSMDYIMTDYVQYSFQIQSLIDKDEKCLKTGSISEDIFQMEINLMAQLINNIKGIILAPEKNGIRKYSDLC